MSLWQKMDPEKMLTCQGIVHSSFSEPDKVSLFCAVHFTVQRAVYIFSVDFVCDFFIHICVISNCPFEHFKPKAFISFKPQRFSFILPYCVHYKIQYKIQVVESKVKNGGKA